MKTHVLSAVLALALAVPAWAGFTTAGFVVGGDSRVGLAAAFANNPTAFTVQSATDVRSQNGGTGGNYLDPGAFATGVQVGTLATNQRRANTLSAADGTFAMGDTLSMTGSASANVINQPVTTSQYKGTAISTVTFTGETRVGENAPGVAISFDADYSMQAFAQNNAPGGFNNNSAYSSVKATLTLENVTAGTVAGQNVFIDDMISQIYCGPPGSCFPNSSYNNLAAGTVFLPISGQNAGDVIRMTIDVVASTDVYAKGFTSGGAQTAGGRGFAWFDKMDVTLLLIPEPASLALIFVGAASIGLFRRLKRT